MSDKTSDTGILDVRFPGYAWMPRWTRRYWTPSTAVAIVFFIFSAGVWWGTFKTAPNQSVLEVLNRAMAPECVKGCLLKREDPVIVTISDHVDELWHWKKRVDNEAELQLQPMPTPQVIVPAPIPTSPSSKRRGGVNR